MIGTDAGAHVFRVALFRGGGEADEIAEEDRDDLPLLAGGWRLLGERSRAEAAEHETVRVLPPAIRAGQHTLECRTMTSERQAKLSRTCAGPSRRATSRSRRPRG